MRLAPLVEANLMPNAHVKTVLRVPAMDCGVEVAAIEQGLKSIPAVKTLAADIPSRLLTISHDDSVSAESLITAIGKLGLRAAIPAEDDGQSLDRSRRNRSLLVAASGIFLALGLLAEWFTALPVLWLRVLYLGAITSSGAIVFPKAWQAAKVLRFDMNVLMTVAVAGALVIGEWSEAASVAFLFALSELLEAYSVTRARRAIESLMKLTPETATKKEGNSQREIPVQEITVGDIVIIKSGSRVPLDGEVVAGNSHLNQAPITGESMPVEKKIGDTIFAGSINGEGSLEVKVTKVFSDTTLSRIIHLVQEAQSQKAPSQRFVDTFARYYTPLAIVAAIGLFLVPPLFFGGGWSVWLYRALVLLVIACPCALVISTPVSVVSGLTAMARKGVLIKGGTHLEEIGKLKALAVDKTGTLTEGNPKVLDVIQIGTQTTEEIVRVAAAIDVHSEHPLARAVVEYAREKGIAFNRSDNYQSKTGRGAQADIDGHPYFVGNHRFTHELAVCSDDTEKKLQEIEDRAHSVIVVGHIPHAGCKGEVLGILAVGDPIRANAKDAVAALRSAGVENVVMLSGDNQRTAAAVGKAVGVDESIGDLLPEHKIDRVRALTARYHHVGMVGDGVNDAPALAAASVGIAMGAIGTDTALETADIALMHDDLARLAEVVILGRRTLRTIRANIAFALGVKAIFLVLAVFGATSLWLAILADTGATLLVIANALRLLRA